MHYGPEKTSGVLLAALAALAGACESSPPALTPSGVTQSTGGSGTPVAGQPTTTAVAGNASPAAMSGRSGSVALAGAGASSLTPAGAAAGALAVAGAGAPAVAGASGATAGAAGGGTTAPAGADMGNYFVSGAWHGYAWATAQGMGSTITPMDFSMQTTGMPRCVMGSVAMTADYSGIAMLGVNLNQENSTGAALMTATPSKAGLTVDVKNNASSPLRVQIQTPNGGTNANERWCAPISGTGGFIPWSSFNTMCWDGSGTAYNKEPISQASILVPGGNMAAVAFDFCLNSLAESDAPTMPVAGAAGAGTMGSGGMGAAGMGGTVDPGNNSGMGTITERYGVAKVMRDGRNYVIQNNVWGDDTEQNISYNGTTYEIAKQTGNNVSSGPGAEGPVSYPSVFIGSNYERTTEGSNLPIQVSAIKSVKTGWSVNSGAGGDKEAPSGGYLMVWFYKPPDAQPIGPQPSSTGVTIDGVPGTWDIWIGPNTGNANRPVISYVRTQATQSMEFDLNAFIKDAVKRPGAIQSSWYLSNVFAGFEIWSGGVGLKTTSFYAIVE